MIKAIQFSFSSPSLSVPARKTACIIYAAYGFSGTAICDSACDPSAPPLLPTAKSTRYPMLCESFSPATRP